MSPCLAIEKPLYIVVMALLATLCEVSEHGWSEMECHSKFLLDWGWSGCEYHLLSLKVAMNIIITKR